MANIPYPPKQIEVSPDVRMEYLLEWKRLFEAISPDIKVYLSSPNNQKANNEFIAELDSHFKSFELSGVDVSEYTIFIERGGVRRYDDIRFLVGDSNGRMFSDREVEENERIQYQENAIRDFFPETKSWEHWYKYLCDEYERIHNSIPKPPNP